MNILICYNFRIYIKVLKDFKRGDRGGHSRYNRLPGGRDRGRCCIAHQEGRRWIRGHVGQDEQDLCWGGGGSCLNKPTSCKRFLNWRSSFMTGSPKAEAGGP